MKKQLTALALSALLFAAAASGCNQTETNTSAQQDPDPAALASALLEGGSFDDQLAETDQQAAMAVLGLDPEQVDQCTAYMGTGATPEEVAVIRATDASAAKEVAQDLDAHLQQLESDYASYAPDEVPKIQKAVVEVKGRTVVLCVSADSQQAEKLLEDAGATQD